MPGARGKGGGGGRSVDFHMKRWGCFWEILNEASLGVAQAICDPLEKIPLTTV